MANKRIPPHNIEAERAVLCSVMLDNNIYDSVRMVLSGSDFYRTEHLMIFESVERTRGDLISVANDLKERGELDKCGGPAYLAELSDVAIPSETLAMQHARIVRDAAKKRSFISKASDMVESCYGGLEFSNLAEILEKEAFSLTDQISTGSEAESIYDIVKRSKARLERISLEGEDCGIMTGLSDFDNMTSGLRDDDLIIIAARPSMGKTALVFNLLKRTATYKIPVGAFSLEMSKDSLGERMLADMARINSKNIRSGWITDKQWPVINNATEEFRSLPMYIDDTPALHISEIRSRARRMKRKHGVRLIAVDYLQLARGDGNNREQEVADISRGLKAMAKELHIPVIGLAQLNRGVEGRADKRPMLSDLRESGAIEQDADVITFIHRPEYYDKNTNKKGIAELIFGKQRNGPTGIIELMWDEGTCSFNNLARGY